MKNYLPKTQPVEVLATITIPEPLPNAAAGVSLYVSMLTFTPRKAGEFASLSSSLNDLAMDSATFIGNEPAQKHHPSTLNN